MTTASVQVHLRAVLVRRIIVEVKATVMAFKNVGNIPKINGE